MSDEDEGQESYDEYDEDEYDQDEEEDDFDFDLEEEEDYNDFDYGQDDLSEYQYTFPKKTSSGGKPSHRMRYKSIEVTDIEKKLKETVENLNGVLQIGTDDCLILLLKYDWNDQKLLEDYTTSDSAELRVKSGLYREPVTSGGEKAALLENAPEDFMCFICCSESTEEEPLQTFRLSHCDHRYCVSCYVRYVREAMQNQTMLIRCPDTSCKLYLRPSEMQQLSDVNEEKLLEAANNERKIKESQMRVPLTEEQIRAKYQHSDDEEEEEEFSEPEEGAELEDSGSRSESEEVMNINDTLFNFHERQIKQEKLEKVTLRNRRLIAKYWYTIVQLYTTVNLKQFKCCPAVDCEGIIEYKGFDSDEITTVDEYVERNFIPIVQCLNGHRFCFHCGREDHAPATCKLTQAWTLSCKDESETSHWITANTKDCPRCSSAIEKNGGCNHMSCGKCGYQFCWICLGIWSKHDSAYNCTKFSDEDSRQEREKQEKSRVSLKRYLFYYELFDIHRVSLKKDTEFLSKLEYRVQEIQQRAGVSWIEAQFYRESIDTLLKCRKTLMWSYALMYYVQPGLEKSTLEKLQNSLSYHIERLSKLFEVTETKDVIDRKRDFLSYANSLKSTHERFLEIHMEIITTKSIFS